MDLLLIRTLLSTSQTFPSKDVSQRIQSQQGLEVLDLGEGRCDSLKVHRRRFHQPESISTRATSEVSGYNLGRLPGLLVAVI